jgi:formimidoylglutamate deiminase
LKRETNPVSQTRLFAESALLSEGWSRDALFEFDGQGNISSITTAASPGDAPRAAGPVIPGMPNLHSHAFQRAMAGLAECVGPEGDSFWTWREVMYGFVGKLQPDDLEAIAAQLYVEMLKVGYTTVGEFHYLHHTPDGGSYEDPAEMSRRVIAAAEDTGIGLTLLPVLYGFGGFDGKAAGEGQRRFLNDPERFARILEALMETGRDDPRIRIGIAPHSLRAVTPETLGEALATLDALDNDAPIHIHIAEQTKEVEDCLAWSGERPVEWLLDRFPVGGRWCLIHATHINQSELQAIVESGAVAGLCPTTEANLGDGIFPAADFLDAGGLFGIGSDSHISVSPIEELRWLEYGQRLTHRGRNLLGSGEGSSVGARLYRLALAGGAKALGRPIGQLREGARADLLVLDPQAPTLVGKEGDGLLDALVFAGNINPVRDVMVGARWVVRDGRHEREEPIFETYRRTLETLQSA